MTQRSSGHAMSATLHPPGPRGHLLLGNITEFRRDRLGFLTRCARSHGDFVGFRLAHRRALLVSRPEAVEQVLVSESDSFIKHFALRSNPFAAVLGKGLLTSKGDFWLRQRRLIQPAFHRPRVHALGATMVRLADRHVAAWRAGETRDLLSEMIDLTVAIAVKALLDADVGEEGRDVGAALQVLQETFADRLGVLLLMPLWFPTAGNRRLRRAVRRIDDVIARLIRERRRSGARGDDVLSLLLNAQDQDPSCLTRRQLHDEVMTLVLAGHETTALALAWTFYLLATHPEADAELAAELRAVLGGRPPTAEDLPRLRFADAVVAEALRLFPPVDVVGREAVAPCEVGGYPVRPGVTVLMSPWVVQRDPRFFEEPEQFLPQRWLDGLAHRLPRYAYFPFGGGPRLCIGKDFALQESVLVLAAVARTFRFTLLPGREVVPWPAFTLRPRPGVPVIVARR